MAKAFDNLAQRGINYFVASVPSFCSVSSEAASAKEQENAYGFIKGLYEKLYKNAELLGMKIYPDDCFQYWWSKKTDKAVLAARIRGYIKSINLTVEALYNIISTGEADGDRVTVAIKDCEINPAILKRLVSWDIKVEKNKENYSFLFPKDTVRGLKLLASISAEHSRKSATAIHSIATRPFLLFSRGIFNPEVPYSIEIFRELFENKDSFDRLIEYCNKNNFIRIDNKEYKTGIGGDTTSLDYVKFYGKPEGVIGNPWKTKNFSGIEFSYDEYNEDCSRVGIHIPYLREVLENADKMSPSLKGFIANWNKCGGCKYCIQMDKTKTKPMRFYKVNDSKICSLFAGGYTFNQFYNGSWMANGFIELMDFVDELFAERKINATL